MNKNRTRIRLGLSSEFFSPKGVKYVSDSVAAEAERAQQAESKLNTALENHMQSADDMFNALGDGRFEVAKATEAQTVANGAISKEKLDGPLQVSVSVVDNLETENTLMPLSALQGVVLDGKIKNEYDSRVYGEKLLESKIAAEIQRAQTAESTLQSELATKPGTKIANKGEVFNASNNSANGSYSHAEGYGTNAAGLADHTEGRETTATGGQGSHAEGWGSETSGNASHVEGYFTQAKNYGEHAEGRCNYSIGGDETPTVHTVGVGERNTVTGAITRKNAHAITRDGKHYLLGVGGYEGREVSGCKDLASVIEERKQSMYGIALTQYKYLTMQDDVVIIRDNGPAVYSITNYLKINGLRGTMQCRTNGSSPFVYAAIYDEELNYIGYLGYAYNTIFEYNLDNLSADIENLELSANAKYIVFSVDYNSAVNGYAPDVNTTSELAEFSSELLKLKETREIVLKNADEISAMYGIEVTRYKYLNIVNGEAKENTTTAANYSVTDFLNIKGLTGSIFVLPYGSNPYTYAVLFNDNLECIGYLGSTNGYVFEYNLNNLSADIENLGLSKDCKYVRFNISYAKTDNGVINLSKLALFANPTPIPAVWWSNTDLYDYEKVLKMPKDVVKFMVETASQGCCTAIYDNDGYPSLMRKFPISSIGAFNENLGSLTDVHPAFIVNGVQKKEVYIALFMTSDYNGHYVSWFGLTPLSSVGIGRLRDTIAAKGQGWHLETIYERSLLSLCTAMFNSPTPSGNTYWGLNAERKWESVQMSNGKIGGQGNQINGAKWINGTQPPEWSHNKTMWGVQDVIGGYHEICDLVKLVDGRIFLAEDNAFGTAEEDLPATDVFFDYINSRIVLSDNKTFSGTISGNYVARDFSEVLCTESYDNIDVDIRKQLTLVGIAPRLNSQDAQSLLGYEGKIGINPSGIGHIVMGGAEEYANSGLGYYIWAFDLNTINAHNNMGSRMCWIK